MRLFFVKRLVRTRPSPFVVACLALVDLVVEVSTSSAVCHANLGNGDEVERRVELAVAETESHPKSGNRHRESDDPKQPPPLTWILEQRISTWFMVFGGQVMW